MSRRFRGWLQMSGLLVLAANAVTAQTAPPGLRSLGTLAAPDLDFELREAALAASGDVWAVVVGRPRGQPTAPESFLLASFDARGEVTRSALQVPGAEQAPTTARRRSPRRVVEDIEVSADGRVVLALAAGPIPASIALVGSSDRQLESPRSLGLSRDAEIHELVVVPGGRLLAAGTAGKQPLVAEITPDGKVIWQQPITGDPVVIDGARATGTPAWSCWVAASPSTSRRSGSRSSPPRGRSSAP
jgi:hypothetical protein